MRLNLATSAPTSTDPTSILSDPSEVIDLMIELRIQLSKLEQQIQALQPAFFAACLSLNTNKINHDRAIISRRLTPAQWTYSSEVLDQEALLKQLKLLFQQDNEPTRGREISWAIKLLLAQARSSSPLT
jgi:hypothetical protein